MRAEIPTPSPCIQVCRLDLRRQICTGCGRTLEEIARWPTMKESERRDVVARLASRATPSSC